MAAQMNMMNANRSLLSVIVCLISMQAVVLLALLLGSVPPGPGMADQVLPEWAASVKPKWDMALFAVFILTALLGQAAALFWLKNELKQEGWGRGRLADF